MNMNTCHKMKVLALVNTSKVTSRKENNERMSKHLSTSRGSRW